MKRDASPVNTEAVPLRLPSYAAVWSTHGRLGQAKRLGGRPLLVVGGMCGVREKVGIGVKLEPNRASSRLSLEITGRLNGRASRPGSLLDLERGRVRPARRVGIE